MDLEENLMSPWNLTEAALQEPWRLWTCHLAHHDWWHAADNALALSVPLVLASRRQRGRLLVWSFLLAPILALALIPFLAGGSYCGISGLACAAWAFLGLQLAVKEDSFIVGTAMLGLLALKFAVESLTGSGVILHDGRWQAISESHLFGTLLGLSAGLFDSRLICAKQKARRELRKLVTIPR
jgi:membrane associated rhomboid family serine protease